jgi:hypothetical protein
VAKRGSKKALSIEQEEYIAKIYGGKRSPSSGAAVTDAGDVKTSTELFECKYHGSPESPPKLKSALLRHMEKVADEAYETGRDPVVALRYYAPDSKLAKEGWVDLTVRLTRDDAERGHCCMGFCES